MTGYLQSDELCSSCHISIFDAGEAESIEDLCCLLFPSVVHHTSSCIAAAAALLLVFFSSACAEEMVRRAWEPAFKLMGDGSALQMGGTDGSGHPS